MPSKQNEKCISSKIPCYVHETSSNKEKFIDLFMESYKNGLTQTMKSQLKRIFMLKLICNQNSIAQRELCSYFRELKPKCDSDKWKGESFRTLSSLIFNYIIQVQLNDRTLNKNKITDDILKIINEITQEHVLMNAPENYVQAVQIFVAKTLSPWLQKPMAFICPGKNIKHKKNKSSNRSEPKKRDFKSKEKPKSNQKCHDMQGESRTNMNKANNCNDRNNRISTGQNKTSIKVQNAGKCPFLKNYKNTQNKNKPDRKKDIALNRRKTKKKKIISQSVLFDNTQGTDQRTKKKKKKSKSKSKTRRSKTSKTVDKSKSISTNNSQQPHTTEENEQLHNNALDNQNRLSSQNSCFQKNVKDENNSVPIDRETCAFKSTDSNDGLNDNSKGSTFTDEKKTDTEPHWKCAAQLQRSCSILAEEFGKKNAKEIKEDIKCGRNNNSTKSKDNESNCLSKINKDQLMKSRRAEKSENEEKFEALAVKDMFKFMEKLSINCIGRNEAKNCYPSNLSDEDSVQSLASGVPARSTTYYDYNDTVTTGQDDTGNVVVVYRIHKKTGSQYSTRKTILTTRDNRDTADTCGCSSRPVETFTARATQIVRRLREVYSQRSRSFRHCDCSK